ncbi:Lsr2 family DNA-binding protein [Streptomyces triculaminicus]|uniref:Lsr2 family DNA-binding protein n=1 Tax=Streptomyces triculaminicus TaxID=2816232 RepID=UPI0037D863C1
MNAARQQGRTKKPAARAAAARSTEDTAAIRAWAKENGYHVNDRGRVPTEVREAYTKAN